VDLSAFFCPNSKCADHGIRGKGNITTSARYGKNKTLLLRCKKCNHRFSENHGTAFMHSNYSRQDIQRIILAIAECNSIRGTARILSYDKDAVNRIVIKAGEHCKKILGNLIRDLCLNECQLDELWAFVKKRKLFPKKTSKGNMADTGSGPRSTRSRS
jgi:transposase-like protein